MVDWLAPEVLLGAGAAVGASALFVYYFLFKSKKSKIKTGPTKAEQQLQALKTEVAKSSEEKLAKPEAKLKSLHEALSQTRQSFWGRIAQNFTGEKLNRSQLDAIEEVLYTSDLGPKTVQRLFNTLENKGGSSPDVLKQTLRSEMMSIFDSVGADANANNGFFVSPEGLTVWMVVGVNGAGKTTTIGKLASQLQRQGKKVMIAAGDTFRAAADEQLKVWSERAQVEIFSPENVKDPSAVAFDAVNKAQAKGFDVVIVDTAGRLHTQKNLMEELKKIKRVMTKVQPTAPHEIILVLDANSGQNAIIQAQQFHEALQVTGVILTKMDGSAKGGVAIGIACDVGLPVKMIGVGESVEDLRPFSAGDFVDSIL